MEGWHIKLISSPATSPPSPIKKNWFLKYSIVGIKLTFLSRLRNLVPGISDRSLYSNNNYLALALVAETCKLPFFSLRKETCRSLREESTALKVRPRNIFQLSDPLHWQWHNSECLEVSGKFQCRTHQRSSHNPHFENCWYHTLSAPTLIQNTKAWPSPNAAPPKWSSVSPSGQAMGNFFMLEDHIKLAEIWYGHIQEPAIRQTSECTIFSKIELCTNFRKMKTILKLTNF